MADGVIFPTFYVHGMMILIDRRFFPVRSEALGMSQQAGFPIWPQPSSAAEGSDFGANFTSFDGGHFFEAEFQSASSTSEMGRAV